MNKIRDIGKKNIGLLSLTGVVVYFICVILLLGLFYLGFSKREAVIFDQKKIHDTGQLLLALDSYYQNSHTIPEKKQYPTAVCSNTYLNSVDYEFTLKRALTGNYDRIDTFAYIGENKYPQDPLAEVTNSLSKRSDLQNCFTNLPIETTTEYFDQVGVDSCLFDGGNYKNCYLYTSSATGDSFRLSYYSEAKKRFVIYEKFRTEEVQISYQYPN